jgi:hypothetical protein
MYRPMFLGVVTLDPLHPKTPQHPKCGVRRTSQIDELPYSCCNPKFCLGHPACRRSSRHRLCILFAASFGAILLGIGVKFNQSVILSRAEMRFGAASLLRAGAVRRLSTCSFKQAGAIHIETNQFP